MDPGVEELARLLIELSLRERLRRCCGRVRPQAGVGSVFRNRKGLRGKPREGLRLRGAPCDAATAVAALRRRAHATVGGVSGYGYGSVRC
ncbi:hypothetical protein GCM10010172_31230 [Paractinoplanes ferrugineus]|uniref:Uncharacterized protein n=1 Tax=Paractinoplanes ferrugineus TaxID=113564 RepID=A0A919J474_9ACTN|nr:hypothetical protein Afe05nite_60250 [Actinoplanes ferrugineus]